MRGWLTWRSFVALTEVYTAPLNLAWLLMGASIAQYHYGQVNWANLALFLATIILFDLAVNITDNYYDYMHARDREGYARHTNVIGRLGLPLRGVWLLGLSLYILSLVPAFILLARTGWPLAVLGVVGYGVGIFYAAGPSPINATPLCEAAVALSITYLVQLVAVYLCVYGTRPLDWGLVGGTFLVCLPVGLVFFTIQLANNVADLDEDIRNGRRTLVFFLGRERSFIMMRVMQALGAVTPILCAGLGLVPWQTALSSLLLPVMWGLMRPFYSQPDKERTYLPLVGGASVFFVGYTLLLATGVWL
ncbi:1,4-dihydroxy-2-naphthoate prenyltransferase [Bifidobacterium xylocopae]|uniref:1,4-dihydroxy-2-naphthoate prenyltransferase n=2 Tax=Bifidobacterium xylocopae TaxID=2493119 RepID=A0A366KFC5_9BIFI|nr:1,4-dihydroxy-2-naphthoate prenyltransferase [Bifidobacterium xylocopae]